MLSNLSKKKKSVKLGQLQYQIKCTTYKNQYRIYVLQNHEKVINTGRHEERLVHMFVIVRLSGFFYDKQCQNINDEMFVKGTSDQNFKMLSIFLYS